MCESLDPDIGVYAFHNQETNEIYLGSGRLSVRERDHLTALRNNRHVNYKFQRAFNRNPGFEFIPLTVGERAASLELEQVLIDHLGDNPHLLNIAKDATAPMWGRKMSEEARQKIGDALRGKPTGSRQTPESAARISQANTGNTYRLGKCHTEETKALLSGMVTERMKDPTHRERIREALVGFVHTEATREKKREIGLQVAQTEEGRQKLLRMAKKAQEATSKPVNVDGVVYDGILEASRQLGIPKSTVFNRINNPSEKFKGWGYAEEEKEKGT